MICVAHSMSPYVYIIQGARMEYRAATHRMAWNTGGLSGIEKVWFLQAPAQSVASTPYVLAVCRQAYYTFARAHAALVP